MARICTYKPLKLWGIRLGGGADASAGAVRGAAENITAPLSNKFTIDHFNGIRHNASPTFLFCRLPIGAEMIPPPPPDPGQDVFVDPELVSTFQFSDISLVQFEPPSPPPSSIKLSFTSLAGRRTNSEYRITQLSIEQMFQHFAMRATSIALRTGINKNRPFKGNGTRDKRSATNSFPRLAGHFRLSVREWHPAISEGTNTGNKNTP